MLSKPAAFTESINACVAFGLPQAVSLPTASNVLPRFQPAPIFLVNATLVSVATELLDADELATLAEDNAAELLATARLLEEMALLDLTAGAAPFLEPPPPELQAARPMVREKSAITFIIFISKNQKVKVTTRAGILSFFTDDLYVSNKY